MLLGLDCTLIEQDAQHVADIEHRKKRWAGGDLPMFAPPPAVDPEEQHFADLFAERET